MVQQEAYKRDRDRADPVSNNREPHLHPLRQGLEVADRQRGTVDPLSAIREGVVHWQCVALNSQVRRDPITVSPEITGDAQRGLRISLLRNSGATSVCRS